MPETRDCCPWCGGFLGLNVAARLLLIAFPWMAVWAIDAYAAPGPLATALRWVAFIAGFVVLLNSIPWIFGTLIRPFRVPPAPADPLPPLPARGSMEWQMKRLAIICPRGFHGSRVFGGVGGF